MKKLIAMVAGVLLLNLSALAQGTILLQNFGTGFTMSGVKDPSGVLVAAGSSQYTIELLASLTGAQGSLQPFATPITTTTWAGGGIFGLGDPAGERVLPGFAAGTFPFFQLRAWNNTGGVDSYAAALAANKAYMLGPVFQLVAGGGLSGLGNPAGMPTAIPAGPLFGMPAGYQLIPVPEPSAIVLGVLGAAALLLRRRK